jgi:hypothetical protein
METLKDIDRLTLRDMINDIRYSGLTEGLIQLPVPDSFKLGKIPHDLNEFTGSICYGQRLFLVRKEDDDYGTILRVMDGYFYTLSTKLKWDEEKALLFGKKVLNLFVKDLYPVAMHLISLTSEMIIQEQTLLHREPSKIELAAGIEKLNLFSELTALYFLRDVLKVTIPEVLLTPYNECLVLFMKAKAEHEFQQNYSNEVSELSKHKFK